MIVSLFDLMLYAAAMAGLWAVPGPVWVALTARSLSGGMAGAWPLAVGVALGDLIWPLCAILGLAWVLSVYGDALELLRWIAAGVFIVMGLLLIRAPSRPPSADSRMTRPGLWAGFSVGMAAVIGNPKAILFYMGFLPGFFDLSTVTVPDIAAILAVSAIVPMLGNLALAFFLDRARRLLQSPKAIARLNFGSGMLLILVGLVIPFT
ncbi:Threonine/homoserine/homoserine lactone efflux protein [Roseovarius tolerans]|uniref:Threonine/homoserine/homoserine lactone efflux protein n=1 Tax=Roseovarius tolerans TaxID=74031 RepID=A0A1H7WJT3_9RHOB|nr:LysE family translocator [Roseovarius tolerans]SEM21763.1 Threonine/homoserine/homoserine lactone efflux protein [Roseovarius tolerans]